MENSGGDCLSKRQRVSRACDLCRKKKIKCDGVMPLCGNCQEFELECSYNDHTKKRGPPKGYIEAIENRLKRLEDLVSLVAYDRNDPRSEMFLAELNAPLETNKGEVINVRPTRKQFRSDTEDATGREKSRSPKLQSHVTFDQSLLQQQNYPATAYDKGLDMVNDSTGQLSIDETGHVRYLGKSSGYYFLQNSRTYQNGVFHFSGWGHKTTARRKAMFSDPLELPPKDLSDHLIGIYFNYFYPALPMFYKKQLVPAHASPPETVSPLLLNAIYAVASRVSPDVRVRADPAEADTTGDVFFERAKILLEGYYDVPRISTVQALLLLATHQHGTMKYVRAWLYSGMAFRMALDLGLHRNCEQWDIPPEEKERRKRVFWCCFIVDRLISAVYGKTTTFEERDCDVTLPTVDDDEPIHAEDDRPTPRLLELFIHMIKICDILGNVIHNIYYAKARNHVSMHQSDHVLARLNKELTNWHTQLPLSLQYKLPNTYIGETAKDPPLPITQMHMMYYTAVILLHRPFIPGPNHPPPPMSLPSYKICISAAVSILDIVTIMLAEKHLKYVYNYAVYFVFTAGIVFIKMASTDDAEKALDAKIYINKTMRALDELEETWMNAARCCNILGELAGLRDINLECDGYVPRRNNKMLNPPPSISVPNSPEISRSDEPTRQWPMQDTAYQVHNMPQVRQAAVDPFESPDVPSTEQPFYPFHNAFWGVPTSLDINEWDNYFGAQSTQPNPMPTPVSLQPLIPSHEFAPQPALKEGDQDKTISTHDAMNVMDSSVPMPLGVPISVENSIFLGFSPEKENSSKNEIE